MANKMETGLKGRWTFYFDNMEADQINAPQNQSGAITAAPHRSRTSSSGKVRCGGAFPELRKSRKPETGTGNQPIPTFVG